LQGVVKKFGSLSMIHLREGRIEQSGSPFPIPGGR